MADSTVDDPGKLSPKLEIVHLWEVLEVVASCDIMLGCKITKR